MAIFRMLGNSIQQSSPVVPKGIQSAAITSADAKQFGLENFGNTCYINAILQALYFCPPFRELVISTPDLSGPKQSIESNNVPPLSARPPSPTPIKRRNSTAQSPSQANTAKTELSLPTSPPTLFSALRSLFIYIAKNPNDKGKVSPTAFVNKVKAENEAFRNTNHQDAHEALNFILNQIMDELEAEEKVASQTANVNQNGSINNAKSKRTLVRDLFQGILTSETRCLTCETVSSRDESFLDLSIDIEPHSSITACLRQFSASEMLCQRNKFSCDSCSGLQEAEKRMKVKKLPNILALHLKRFKYQEDAQKFIKLSYRVAFPFELRLFNTVDDAENADRLYELFAIVVHIGVGPHHGHYTTIIKTQSSWFLYDDDNVETVKESEIPKYFGESPVGAGYVLFYQAVDMNYAEVGLSNHRSRASSFHKTSSQGDENPSLQSNGEAQSTADTDLSNLNPAASSADEANNTLQPLLRSVPSSQPIHLTNVSASQDSAEDKEALTTRLRHIKSEKIIGGSPLSYDQHLPPPPTSTRRPKTGDGNSSGNRMSWLKGRGVNKRTQEPPSSYSRPSNTKENGGHDKNHHRPMTQSTSQDPLLVNSIRPDPTSETSPHRSRSTGFDRHFHVTSAGQNQGTQHVQQEIGHHAPTLKSSRATPVTPLPPSSPFANLRSENHPIKSRGHSMVPIPKTVPPSENESELSSHAAASSATTHNLTGPLKKAVRKMSLNGMPLKLTGLGKRER